MEEFEQGLVMLMDGPQKGDTQGGSRVLLVDPSVLGQSHLLVNLGLIHLCIQLFDVVDVVAERTHCAALEDYGACETGRVVLHPYDSNKKITAAFLRKLSRTAPIIFSNLEYRLFFLIMLSRLPSHRAVFWVLHSHFAQPPSSVRSRLKFMVRRLLLFGLPGKARFIVYGDRIRANLLKAIGTKVGADQLSSVIHPLGVMPLGLPEVLSPAGPVRLSFVRGWHTSPPHITAVVAALAAESEVHNRFSITSIVNTLTVNGDGARVINSDYRARMNKLDDTDLVLYLPTNDYTLQASGALMDSFVSGRPLIGLRTDFAEEVQEVVGPIGFFFDSPEEILTFVQSLSDPDRQKNIRTFAFNLEHGYSLINARAVAQLRNALAAADVPEVDLDESRSGHKIREV